jgi:hypothetical protein
MGEQRTIELSDSDLERVWQLTCSLAANDSGPRHTLDVLFITAARFVDRVAQGLDGEGVVLDSGKAGPTGPLTYLIRRKP